MKNIIKYNKYIIQITFIIALFFSSCKHQEKEDAKETAEEHNKAKYNNSKESKFLVEAAEISYREIELGKLAQNDGGSANIREMGKMMETDHSELIKELKKLANRKLITIPEESSSRTEEIKNDLGNKAGNDFDKHYCDLMVDGQKEAIKKYKSASEDIADIDIKNYATKSLTLLRNHLDHAITCKEAQKNM
jgi:putative membrane protein